MVTSNKTKRKLLATVKSTIYMSESNGSYLGQSKMGYLSVKVKGTMS